MQRYKLPSLLIAPAIIAGLVGFILFICAKHGSIYTHDVFESHSNIMLLPFICAGSFFLGYVPAFCYLSKLLYAGPVESPVIDEVREIAGSQAPALYIGQVITQSGTNCGLRVKALKSIFAGLQDDQFNHCLQFSY